MVLLTWLFQYSEKSNIERERERETIPRSARQELDPQDWPYIAKPSRMTKFKGQRKCKGGEIRHRYGVDQPHPMLDTPTGQCPKLYNAGQNKMRRSKGRGGLTSYPAGLSRHLRHSYLFSSDDSNDRALSARVSAGSKVFFMQGVCVCACRDTGCWNERCQRINRIFSSRFSTFTSLGKMEIVSIICQ